MDCCSLTAQKYINEMKMIVMSFFNLLPEDSTSTVQNHLQLTQKNIVFVKFDDFIQRVSNESAICGQILCFIELSIAKMLVKDIDCKVFRDMRLSLSIKIIKESLYHLLSSHLQAHSHLMLKIYLNIVAKITAYVNFHLQSSINAWYKFWTALFLMIQFGTYLTAIRTVMNMLTLAAIFKWWVILSAIHALRKYGCAILIHCYFCIFQQERSVLAIVIKNDLQIVIKCQITSIQTERIPTKTSLHQCSSLELRGYLRDSMQKCKVSRPESEGGEGGSLSV